jgi:hypothetical protein
MLKLLLAFGFVVSIHLTDRPELNEWAESLKAGNGMPCCENAEAHPLEEPEWRVNSEGHYEVFLEGAWWDVPDSAVVQGPNKYGRVLVWYAPVRDTDGKVVAVYIRCFLPAAGA